MAEAPQDPSLTFMMGEFEAVFPTDRQYAKNHMWALANGDHVRFGFTAYAVRLLQDVYFLDWLVDVPANFKESQEIGSIESKKAESALYAPGAGELVQLNDSLMEDPSAINTDKYGDGWLFDMKLDSPEFLSAKEYLELLVDVWKKTQRTIKGQLNE
jgi:glycine cleavage system H protein